MRKRQTLHLTFLLLFVLVTFMPTGCLFASYPGIKLTRADSLFKQKKYTESFELYEDIFHQEGKATPRMLLKMAFIKEGLGEYSQALYYLNEYYLQTSNKRALKKMEELAESKNLKGYAYTDTDFFLNFYYKYLDQITLATLAVALLLFAMIFYQKRKQQKRPVTAGIAYVLVLGALFYLINYGNPYQQGIVLESNTYLMSGPSAGAEVVDIINQGHKIDILGKEDVWVKVRWQGNIAYLRENNIKAL